MTDVNTHTSYKLMRARDNRMLGGVAAGLAKASGLDVTVVRVCLGATVLTFGLGVPAYILMWVVLPEESPERGRMIEPAPEPVARYMRIAIVGIAALSVVNQLGGFSPFNNPSADGFGWGGVMGLVLLGIGASVLFSRHRPDRTWLEPGSPPSPASPTSWRAPSVDDDTYFTDDSDDDPPTYVGPFRDVVAPVTEALTDAIREVRTTMTEARPSRPNRSAAPTRPTPPSFDDDDYDEYDDYDYGDDYGAPPARVAMVTSSGLTESGGAALGFARVIGWIAVIWFTIAAIATTAAWIFGAVTLNKPIVLAVISWLVFIAVLNTLLHTKFTRAIIPTLALLLIPVAIGGATIRPNGDIGHQVIDSASLDGTVGATLSERMAVGRLDFNLADVDFTKPETTINGRVGVGAIFVEVPNDVAVTVNAKTGAGGYEVLNRSSDGPRGTDKLNFPGCEGAPKLTLNLRSGAGFIQVHRENGKTKAVCGTAA